MPSPRCFVSTAALLALALVHSFAADVNPAAPIIPARVFKFADFAVVADGTTSNTEAFKRAVAAVEKVGGGTLVVAAGKYLTGPIDLCSSLNLHLDAGATIVFSSNPDDYRTEPNKYRPLLLTKGAHDVMISGASTAETLRMPAR